MLIFNASAIKQTIQANGSWFTFKPKEVKNMNDEKGQWVAANLQYLGFVALPASMEDLEFSRSKEGEAIKKAKENEGVASRVQHLEWLRQNEMVALQRDIDRSNQKYDARLDMSPQAIDHLEELAGYKKKVNEESSARLARIAELEKAIAG